MSDWTGSSGHRKRDREDCLYPDAPKTPGRKLYFIKTGTLATARRSGNKAGRMIRTSRDLTFDEPHDRAGDVLVFFQSGWLLSVRKNLVEVIPEPPTPRGIQDTSQ